MWVSMASYCRVHCAKHAKHVLYTTSHVRSSGSSSRMARFGHCGGRNNPCQARLERVLMAHCSRMLALL